MNICTYSFEEYLHLMKSFQGHPAPGLIVGGFMIYLDTKRLDARPEIRDWSFKKKRSTIRTKIC